MERTLSDDRAVLKRKLTVIEARIGVLLDRIADLEKTNRVVDDLPAHAPLGVVIRLRGDGALYLGNGPVQPLSKLVPTPL